MIAIRLVVGVLGLVLVAGGATFGVFVQQTGAPWIWLLGWALAVYGAWLAVQAIRMPRR